ncbi:MAG: hypothetical protein JSR46_05445, partial [Verrucomicrobia bacterium]|nr:hypothetical protein [Verrucomicrobiota bacterium]
VAFRKYIVTQEMQLQNCLTRLKDWCEGRPVDTAKLQERLQKIIKKCIVKDLVKAIYDFGNLSEFKRLYGDLLDVFATFEKSSLPIQELFAALENRWIVGDYGNIQPFQTIIESYKRTIFSTNNKPQVMALQYEKATLTPFCTVEVEQFLATIAKKFLENDKCKPQLVSILKNCLERYRPLGQGTMCENINPMAYTRRRTTEIEEIISECGTADSKERVAKVVAFLGKSSWNQASCLREPSVNVMLLSQIGLASFEQYKKELTFTQLKEQATVEVCYSADRKELNMEQLAQKVYEQLKRIIASEQLTRQQIY